MKKLKKHYNQVVLGYFIFGISWILFSDKVLNFYVKNVEIIRQIEKIKGLIFIFTTTVVLYFLLKKHYKKNFKLISLTKENQEMLEKNEIVRKKKLDSEQEFFNIIVDLFEKENITDEEYVKKIFRNSFEIIDEVDFGSAYIIYGDKVEYIDAIGYDLDSLNRLDKSISKFYLAYNQIKYTRNLTEIVKKKLINQSESETNILLNIKESVFIGIAISDELKGGISLDISKDSIKSYSKESINKLKAFHQIINSTYKIKKSNDQFKEFHHDIISSFLAVFEHHDLYTKGHSESVAEISIQIGKKMKLSRNELNKLYWAGILHDIGKIVIPTNILNKPGKLTPEEFELIKKHPVIGYEIILKSKSLEDVAKYVLYHHERWDGKGYPNGLKEEEIPLISQIISVADSWHAMTSERVYKKVLTKEEALSELLLNKGTQFPPDIVNYLYEIITDG